MAFARDSSLTHLLDAPMRPGVVTWIGLRPARHAPMVVCERATLIAGQGIAGDRYRTARNGGRQVTLIAAEDLAALAAFLDRDTISPDLVRRNIVTRGINLVALKDRRFRIGEALLEGAGDCAPCSRMETALGEGGYNAMRGRGGLCAWIIEGGELRIGDRLVREDSAP